MGRMDRPRHLNSSQFNPVSADIDRTASPIIRTCLPQGRAIFCLLFVGVWTKSKAQSRGASRHERVIPEAFLIVNSDLIVSRWQNFQPSGPGPTAGFIFFGKPQRKRTKRNGSLAAGISVRGYADVFVERIAQLFTVARCNTKALKAIWVVKALKDLVIPEAIMIGNPCFISPKGGSFDRVIRGWQTL
jgi:hypothetical protein